jgi:Fe(3+) dicitrate transport protein
MVTPSTALYANISQAYRPILYAALTPFGSTARVDRTLRTASGYNADFGWRGTAGGALKFDVGVFYLSYRNRIGTKTVDDAGGSFLETSNIGDSRHMGVESYLEIDPLALYDASLPARLGSIDVFDSFAYVDARYVSGEFAGNRVEQAPRIVNRTGVTYGRNSFAVTLQASYTSSSFGDANNSVAPSVDDGATGLVPAYTVLDLSTRTRLTSRFTLNAGVNNLANVSYFTKRTAEYPGPGILPGVGRGVYAGIAARF